jgi:hypothetical protein
MSQPAEAAPALRVGNEPVERRWIRARVLVDDLGQARPSISFLTGSSCFLPVSVRGISATCTTRPERSAATPGADLAPDLVGERVVQCDPGTQDDEQRHEARLAEILDVDDQAVETCGRASTAR